MVNQNPSKIPWGHLASILVFLLHKLAEAEERSPAPPQRRPECAAAVNIWTVHFADFLVKYQGRVNLSLAGLLSVGGTEGAAVASVPSHQGAAQRKWPLKYWFCCRERCRTEGARRQAHLPNGKPLEGAGVAGGEKRREEMKAATAKGKSPRTVSTHSCANVCHMLAVRMVFLALIPCEYDWVECEHEWRSRRRSCECALKQHHVVSLPF